MTPEYIGALIALTIGTAFGVYMAARRPAMPYAGDEMTVFEQEVLPLFEATPEKAAYVKKLRETALRLGRMNPDGITSDPLHDACPIPQGMDKRIMGAAFQKRDGWVQVGYVPSQRKVNHGRPVMKWRLA